MLAFFLTHFVEYFYLPSHGPWYLGNVYGNVFVWPLVALVGFAWSKTKFWPLRPLKHILSHVIHHTMLMEEIHHKLHTGEDHPRVQARRAAGEHPTPRRDDG
jgi:hypothetical protein